MFIWSLFMFTIDEILKKLYRYYDVISDRELAVIFGISPQSITNWKSRNAVAAIKKKCRELGIYNDIFRDEDMSFTQHGSGNQQIGTQNTSGNGVNIIGGAVNIQIDDDIIKLVEALNSVAIALDKKEELKNELIKLISTLPRL